MPIVTVTDMVNAAKKLNFKAEMEQALFEVSDDVVRLQREQLKDGIRSDDEQIYNVKTGSIYYSESYAKYKGKDEPIDLEDTGDFYAEIETKQSSNGLLAITDTNWKFPILTKHYGKQILGLGSEATGQLGPIANVRLVRNINIQLGER